MQCNMFQYICYTLICTCILLWMIIKVKYPFWNIQPVIHSYDYWRFLYREPFTIYKYVPIKTKFCDFDQIFTFSYYDFSDQQKKYLINLLQCYYLPDGNWIHNIHPQNIKSYFSGHREPSFVSLFYEKLLKEDKTTIYLPEPTGCITSIPVNVYFLPTLREQHYTKLSVYFMNYLTIYKNRDKTTMNRSLFQTHEYNQRVLNSTIQHSLFKKEGHLYDGILPYIEWDTYMYKLRELKFPSLPPHLQVSLIDHKNNNMLFDFITMHTRGDFQHQVCLFNTFIFPDYTNLIELIKEQMLMIFCLYKGQEILGVYVFKDILQQNEDSGGFTIRLIASISNIEDTTTFYTGFLFSLQRLLKTHNKFKFFMLDNCSHNFLLYDTWKSQMGKPIETSRTGYYLFNFIHPSSPLDEKKTCIIL